MNQEKKKQEEGHPRDLTTWFAGRRTELERRVEETCQRAITKARGVLAEEIRGLSRRVEKMHELLDQLEHLVEAQDLDLEVQGAHGEEDLGND